MNKYLSIGYPGNQMIQLDEFYHWYISQGLHLTCQNNAGDPFDEPNAFSTQREEREVIEFFAPRYGFEPGQFWGLVTNGGTDGNNQGIYFGAKYLKNSTGQMPILYVSNEAHYSIARLADLQNLDIRIIDTDRMGRMIPEAFEAALDTTRPCLIVFAMGSTFKGAIDDQHAINEVLARYPDLPVYRHVDAALFGGYLPYTEYRDKIDRRVEPYNSISISGHKFFGMDEPSGLFITTREIYDHQNKFCVGYLNNDMKMINCSRSALHALKFRWLIERVGETGWKKDAALIFENTAYLVAQLTKIGCPCWVNDLSNTVFFPRPSKEIVAKYNLAGNYDEQFGGELNHIVVLQHVSKEVIDTFVSDLRQEKMTQNI